ncbi:MAG TPA: hypothetical protein DD473_13600 [Planctomycetaceae bacterium]|nr:hypothetical protein [Planctomycetaceae bacterium]|tara:strand:+ start:835 stop:1401 length:567 start_codon:yes stop_codon:yes gene_type:complete
MSSNITDLINNSQATELDFKESPLLRGLNQKQIEIVVSVMEHLCYEANTLILKQGEQNKGLWLISEGCCEVTRYSRNHEKHRVIAVLGPGTIFGEMSFFRKTPHSANVRTVSNSTVHMLSQDAFEQLRLDSSEIAATILINLVSVVSERLKLMDGWVCALTEQTEVPANNKYEEWHDFRAKLYREWNF